MGFGFGFGFGGFGFGSREPNPCTESEPFGTRVLAKFTLLISSFPGRDPKFTPLILGHGPKNIDYPPKFALKKDSERGFGFGKKIRIRVRIRKKDSDSDRAMHLARHSHIMVNFRLPNGFAKDSGNRCENFPLCVANVMFSLSHGRQKLEKK